MALYEMRTYTLYVRQLPRLGCATNGHQIDEVFPAMWHLSALPCAE